MQHSLSENNLAILTALCVLLILALMLDITPVQTTIENTKTKISDNLVGRWVSLPKGIAIIKAKQTEGIISAPASHLTGLLSSVVLEGVTFKSNSNDLDESSYQILNAVAKKIKRISHEKNFEIAGHSDNTGSSLKNMEISTQRAESVMNYLISQGIKSKRLIAVGYGDSLPTADNATNEGREINRRVELNMD